MPQVIEPGFIELGAIRISNVQLTVLGVVIALCVVLTLFLYKTKYGKILRAVSQDKTAAALVGVNASLGIQTTKYKTINLMYGAFWAGIGGAFMSVYYRYIDSTMIGLDENFNILKAS